MRFAEHAANQSVHQSSVINRNSLKALVEVVAKCLALIAALIDLGITVWARLF